MNAFTLAVLKTLALGTPFLAVLAVGFGVCFKYRHRNLPLSKWVSCAFTLFGIHAIAISLFTGWVATWSKSMSTQEYDSAVKIHGFISGALPVFQLIAWVVLIFGSSRNSGEVGTPANL